jgi:hypothetical protein
MVKMSFVLYLISTGPDPGKMSYVQVQGKIDIYQGPGKKCPISK